MRPDKLDGLPVERVSTLIDGEREIEFHADQKVMIQLDLMGPLTIDTGWVMDKAAQDGLLVSGQATRRRKENTSYATQPK